MPNVRQLIITFEDYEKQPFTIADMENFQGVAEELLGDYDIEIKNVEIKEVNET